MRTRYLVLIGVSPFPNKARVPLLRCSFRILAMCSMSSVGEGDEEDLKAREEGLIESLFLRLIYTLFSQCFSKF
jgi:hypothetical protein